MKTLMKDLRKPKKVKAEKVLDLSNPIVQVVLPLKVDAAEKAKQAAEEMIVSIRKKLKENEWDIEKVAPTFTPNGGWAGMAAWHVRRLYEKVTTWDYKKQPGPRGLNTPCIVKMEPKGCSEFVKDSIRDAEKQYDLFVMKLTEKIGQTTAASLEGNHVWDESILTVTLPGGEVEKWKTKQIINVSKYGKLFFQWPTRLLK